MPIGVYVRTKKIRQSISKGCLGMKWSEEAKLKLSQTSMGEGNHFYGKHHIVEAKQKISEFQEKTWAERSKKERLDYMIPAIETNQKRWDKMTKEQKLEQMFIAIKASQKANPSSIEKLIWKELDKLEIKYKTQVLFNNSKFIVDIYISKWKLIIECNGTYWHNYKIFPEKEIRDKKLQKYCNKNKIKLIWLWESDIRNNSGFALIKGFKKAGINIV